MCFSICLVVRGFFVVVVFCFDVVVFLYLMMNSRMVEIIMRNDMFVLCVMVSWVM